MNSPERISVLGVGISVTNMQDAVWKIQQWLSGKGSYYVCVTGVHGVMECQKDKELLRIHNASGLTVPDGMPMVWAGRLYGFRGIQRVYGPELMLELCRVSVAKGYSHFLYGGKVGVVEELKDTLEGMFPGIKISGVYTPPFRPLTGEELVSLQAMVSEAKPDIFWVGLSTPKQERFMAEYLPRLNVRVMVGVGAAFDIHTGKIKDAPDWVKKSGIQWIHRLIQEPRRLWRRYLINNPLFVLRFMWQYVAGVRRRL